MNPSSGGPSNGAIRVKLTVRAGKGGGADWEHVRVNGTDYAYHYTGGSKEHGNHVAYKGRGKTTLHVELLDPHDRYEIRGCTFKPEIPDEFWFTRTDATNALVHDACNLLASTEYTILVLDTKLDNIVPCHPMMKNIPPP